MWFAALLILPLVVGQNIAPAFRPDSVTTVTGTVRCGNNPASFLTVEWWEDRGQQIDTLLGSTITDSQGRFQVNSRNPAPPNTYLFIRNNCNGASQGSRFDVSLLAPFNMQIQLSNGGSNGGVRQVSGNVFCGRQPAVWQTVEWFADRGNQFDIPLGSSQTDGRGFFIITTRQQFNGLTYLLIRNNCNGFSQITRVNVNSSNMQIQLSRSGRGFGGDPWDEDGDDHRGDGHHGDRDEHDGDWDGRRGDRDGRRGDRDRHHKGRGRFDHDRFDRNIEEGSAFLPEVEATKK